MSESGSDAFEDPRRTFEGSRQASAYSSAWDEEDHLDHATVLALAEQHAAGVHGTIAASPCPGAPASAAGCAPVRGAPAEEPAASVSATAAEAAARTVASEAPGSVDALDEPAPLLQQLAAASLASNASGGPESGPSPPAVAATQRALADDARWRPAHARHASNISFGSLASDSQLQTLGAASDDGGAAASGSGDERGSSSGGPASEAGDSGGGAAAAVAAALDAATLVEDEPLSLPGASHVPSSSDAEQAREQPPREQPGMQQPQAESAPRLKSSSWSPGELEEAAAAAAMSPASRLELRRMSSSSPEQDEDSAWGCWSRRRRHFFIVTSAGKPVYSRHGDEAALAGFLAVIQAVVSVVGDQGDGVRHVSSGPLNVVFLMRGHLYLVAASSRAEPVAALRAQLHLLHQHLLMLVTGGVERALQRNPGYDVRHLLGASHCCLSALLSSIGDAPFWMMGVMEPAPLSAAERRAAAAALAAAVQVSESLYGVISAGHQVVALEAGKGSPPLPVLDTQLLLNFLTSNEALRGGETFVPVCLPGVNATAYLHAYVACLDASSGVFLTLLSGGSDAFSRLAGQRAPVEAALQEGGVLQSLSAMHGSAAGGRLRIEALPPAAGGGVPGSASLWHFAAAFPGRRQGVQATHAAHVFPDRRARKELSRAYVRAYCALHARRLQGGAASSSSGGGVGGGTAPTQGAAAAAAAYMLPSASSGPRPARMLWVACPRWCLLALADREVELFCCFDPLVPQESAVRAGEALRRWLTAERGRTEALLLPLSA